MAGAYDQAYGAPQPPEQPQAPVQAAQGDPQKNHVHHSYIWLGTIQSLFAVLVVIVISSASSLASLLEAGDLDFALAGGIIFGGLGLLLVVLVAVVAVIHWLSYKHLYYVLGPDEFSLYSGIITKKRVHVPYDRVQSVDAQASLLQRIFGVRSVYIDTAGGASNKAVVVPYLTKARADQLTAELYARKRQALQPQAAGQAVAPAGQPAPVRGNVLDMGAQAWNEVGGVFAGQPIVQEAPSFEYGLTNKELFLAGLSNNTSFALLILAFLGVVSQVLGFAFDLFPAQTDAALTSLTAQAADPLFAVGTAFTVGALLVLLAVIWVLSAVGTCIGFGGFRARRVGDRIEVERGLLQHTRQSLSIQRVQAVVVKQSVIRRLIGYCEVSLDKIDAGGDDEQQQKNSLNTSGVVVHPFCKLADVPGILAGLVPEYAGMPQDRTPLPKVALRRAITRRCIVQGGGFWTAVVVAVAQLISNAVLNPELAPSAAEAADAMMLLSFINPICIVLYAFAAICCVLEAVSAVKWARESGFSVSERFMKVVNGGLAREERTFPRAKIQFGLTKANPLQRAAGVASIRARTAAGVGGTTVELKDAAQADADAWLAWLEPRI